MELCGSKVQLATLQENFINVIANSEIVHMMMLISIKQHLNNIWSSINEKVKQHWGWVEKKHCLEKKVIAKA